MINWLRHSAFKYSTSCLGATCFTPSMKPCPNGGSFPPQPNSILIWKPSDEESSVTALITEVSIQEGYIKINQPNLLTPKHFRFHKSNDQFYIEDDSVLGWMVFYPNKSASCPLKTYQKLAIRQSKPFKSAPWLDLSRASHKYWSDIWGTSASRKGDSSVSFYTFNKCFYSKILEASKYLHSLCLKATEKVIHSDELLEKFALPEEVWPLIRKSWARQDKSFAGRFDFGLNKEEIKMFEYNSDSAGAYLETSSIQEHWARGVGWNVGISAAEGMEEKMVLRAKNLFSGFVHLMIDEDDEELYNALYIQEVFKKAGIESKVLAGTRFTKDRKGFVDDQGKAIKSIWKMWNWDTILADYQKDGILSQIMLNENIQVCEPLWKIVTSNKAILPVVFEMEPRCEFLLKASWEVNDLGKSGFVKKPIVGRCGENIEIYKNRNEKIEEVKGRFGKRNVIFQEVFESQNFDGYFPVIGSWIIGNEPAGFIIREDQKMITDHSSPCVCCRIIE